VLRALAARRARLRDEDPRAAVSRVPRVRPKPDLAAIQVPVLAITGDKDLNVDPRDLDVIARIVPGPVETRRFPYLTHILHRDPGPASWRNYREQYRRPVDPGLLEEMANWVSAHLQGRG
jgi:pimeloyl-ACP methyl ester carboxylesterase